MNGNFLGNFGTLSEILTVFLSLQLIGLLCRRGSMTCSNGKWGYESNNA